MSDHSSAATVLNVPGSTEIGASSVITTDSGEGISAVHQVLADRYEILGLLGVGGMGSVYRARDRELEEIVALKMLRRELVDMPGILDRFRREVKLARRVTHKNVARVYDIGEHGGEKFLTMEFVDGESLATAIGREGAFGVARAIEIASGICAGLAGAHAAGVVHRDLKPDNVLMAKDGRVVITDFGIARALLDLNPSHTGGQLLGTPAYMAPEQVEGKGDIDARADIYALGALLYELFTGQRAWAGDSPIMVAAARLMNPPPDPRHKRPDLPTACADVVLRCMARARDDRFAQVDQVAAAFAQMTLPIAAPAPITIISVRSSEVGATSTTAPASALTSSTPPAPVAAVPDKTVAVIPFRNAGPAEDEYLAEELTDDLIDSLSMTRGLKVRSRSAVARFKGVERDSREVGRELEVQVVVEGSVRRARGSVRVSARLTSVAEGFQLWAKRFDRPEQDVLSINDDAAKAIAEALTLDRDAEARSVASNPAAVDLYLRGRHEYRKFWGDNQNRALELFEQAEALAPGDPMILSGKALAMARRSFFLGEGAHQAIAVAREAVAAAPHLAEARVALGTAFLQVGDWISAARELKQAVARGPGIAEAHSALGRLLAELGAISESNRFLETAITLDPIVPLATGVLARNHALCGDWAKAEAIMNGLDAVANRPMLSRFIAWRRDAARAKELRASLAASGDLKGPTALMLDLIMEGKLPQTMSIFPQSTVEGDSRRRTFLSQIDVEGSAYVGDLDRAFKGLTRSVESGLIDIAWLDRCPLLDAVRADPRFPPLRAIVKKRVDEVLAVYRAA